MKTEILNHFGSQKAMAMALNVERQTIRNWGDIIPPLYALVIERLTGGKFKAETINPQVDELWPYGLHRKVTKK